MKMVIFGNVSCHDSASVSLDTPEGKIDAYQRARAFKNGAENFFFQRCLFLSFMLK